MTVRIEAVIKWDEGDRSVNIHEGWDLEQCAATVHLLGDLMLIVSFEPDEDKEVRAWKVHQIDITRRTGTRRNPNRVGADEPTYASLGYADDLTYHAVGEKRDVVLGDFPDEIVNSVEVEWKTVRDLLDSYDEELERMMESEPR